MEPKQMKILLVDDFELARNLLSNALSDLGFQRIEQAENGRVAFEKLEKACADGQPFDMIFSDWHMPEVSGFELLKMCRAHEAIKRTPFVMVSAETETDSIVQALKTGATDFINKPISREALRKKLDKVQEKVAKSA